VTGYFFIVIFITLNEKITLKTKIHSRFNVVLDDYSGVFHDSFLSKVIQSPRASL
jgi:hypothetical protein